MAVSLQKELCYNIDGLHQYLFYSKQIFRNPNIVAKPYLLVRLIWAIAILNARQVDLNNFSAFILMFYIT